MKKVLIFLFVCSLCSFSSVERKKASSIALITEPKMSLCNTPQPLSVEENLSEQISTFFKSPLDTQWWPARWQCGVWSPFHGWLYIGSDITIGLSYFLIPVILLYFIYQRKQQAPFRLVVVLFILFILACGLTHFIDASMFWWPAYRLNALLRFATAIISMGTVVALVKITPQLMRLESPESMESTIKNRTEELRKSMLLISAYQHALDESCIVAITDQHGIIKHVNENFCKISKYSKEELIGKDHRIINSGHHPKEFIHNLWKTIAAGRIWKGELKNKAKDGSTYWVDTTIVPFLDEHGKPYQYVAIRADITERKIAEENLQKSLKETSDYKHALDKSAIVAITNQQGIIKHVNENFCSISKYTVDELIGQDHRIINSGYHPKEFIKDLWKTISDGKVWNGELRNKAKDGSIYWVATTIVPFLDAEGKPYQYVAIRSDITQRKESEAQQALLALIVNSSDDGIISVDTNSNITSWNQGAKNIFGYSSDEAVGKHISMLLPTNYNQEEADIMKKILSGQYVDHYETERQRKDGTQFPVSITVSAVRDSQSNIKGVSKIIRDISYNKQAESEILKLNQALILSERKFRGLIENSHDAIGLTNSENKVIYRSPAYWKITGWSAAEFEQTFEKEKALDLIHAEDREEVRKIISESIARPGILLRLSYRFMHRDGHYIWLEGTIINFLHDESIKCLVTNLHDATETKKAERNILNLNEELAKSERKFRSLIEQSHDIISLSDENLQILYRSPSAERTTGWTAEDRLMKDPIEKTHPDDLPKFKKLLAEILKNPGKPFPVVFRTLHKKGHYIWLEGMLTNMLHDDSVNAIVANWRDVTERKNAEEKIKQSERIYRTIASNIPGSVIFLLDNDYRYLLVEGSLITQLGYSKEQLLGKLAKDALKPDRYSEMLPSFIRVFKGESFSLEFDRESYQLLVKFVPLKDEHENVYTSMVVILDITEQKKAEQKIAELNVGLEQKVIERTNQLVSVNKELEAFSYSVSHDLRAPLRAVNGYAKMLEEDYHSLFDDNGKRLLGIVQENARRMGQLIDDLLAFSRLGRKEIQKTNIDMTRLAKEALEELKITDSGVLVKMTKLHSTWGDSTLLKQVLLNYISNALKYSSRSERPRIEIRSILVNQEIIYSVQDNGTGFDMIYGHKLFQVFQRLHSNEEYEGTGVGLAIVDRIIKKHNGRVWAEGKVGEGATFFFSLPAESSIFNNLN